MGWTRCRRAAGLWLVLLPLLMSVGTGSARASCTYNEGPDAFSFSSGDYYSASPSSVYTSSDLSAGQDQCWYGHAWSDGYFQNAGAEGFGYLAGYPWDDINVSDHGWIDVCMSGNPGWGGNPSAATAPWGYETYGDGGQSTGGEINGSPSGCGPGSVSAVGGFSASRAGRSRALAASSTRSRQRAVFFSGGARSRATRSVTFHIYNGRTGKPLGSVCLAPVDVADVGLGILGRMGTKLFYVGVTERPLRCGDPRLTRRERAGRPLPDLRYETACDSINATVTRIYRYPRDFQRRSRPSCKPVAR
jgi:hypothetical protein